MSLANRGYLKAAGSVARMLLRPAAGYRRLHADRRGSIAMLAVVALPVAAGFSALAVDASYLAYRNSQLRATTDAAVLAGSAMLPDIVAATSTAISYAQKNMPSARFGNVLPSANVQAGTWNASTHTFTAGGANPTALKVTLLRTVANGNPEKFYFGSMLGFGTVNLVKSAVATYGTNSAWDVMIVHDVSQSFSSEMTSSKAADLQLLTCQKGHAGGTSQFGLSVFTGFGYTQATLAPIGVTANYNTLTTKISALSQCGTGTMPKCSGSNIAAGLYQALLGFTSATYHPAATIAGKAVVLVTDGAPNTSSSAQPYGTAQGGTGTCTNGTCTDANLQTFAQTQANALWAQGVSVFTIFYSGSNSNATADGAYLASLVRGKGKAYATPTASQLSTMMSNVCATMPHALVQ